MPRFSTNEFLHRYGGTYVGLQRSDAIHPIWITDEPSEEDYEHESIYGKDIFDGDWLNFYVDDNWVDYPDLGWVNVTNYDIALYFERFPEQQWRRGVTGNNVGVLKATDFGTGIRSGSMMESCIVDVMNPKYLTATDAYERVKSGETVSSAFDPKCVIVKYREGIFLRYFNAFVGSFAEDGVLLLPKTLDYLIEEIDLPINFI